MNFLGELCQKEIEKTDVVLDMGCGIMQATLDMIPTYPKTRLLCAELVGIDRFRKYLEVIKTQVSTVEGDILSAPFREKSVDVILLLDVLEHLVPEDVSHVLRDTERIARKKIIVSTPFKWSENENINAYDLGENVLQRHKTIISPRFLAERGFDVKVVRFGLRLRFWKRPQITYAVRSLA